MVYPSKLSLDRIADAAVELAQHEGADALAMRAVAQRLCVQASSLYKHVGDLAGLQALVAERAAVQLLDRLVAARENAPAGAPPSTALQRAARAYAEFAREQPALYALLVTDTAHGALAAALPQTARKALWNELLTLVSSLSGRPDDTGATVAVWAFLHGFMTLEQAGLFGASGPHDGFSRGVDALASGLGAVSAPLATPSRR